MNGATIGKGAVVGAGALVKENMQVGAHELVVGIPGKVVKTLPEEVMEQNIKWARKYVKLAGVHQSHQDSK